MSAQVHRTLQSILNQRAAFQQARIQSMTTASVFALSIISQVSEAMPPPLPKEAKVDRTQPDTLGWRAWYWVPRDFDMNQLHLERDPMPGNYPALISPVMGTVWESSELHVREPWDERDVVRGAAGIHARRMPYDWKKAAWPRIGPGEGPGDNKFVVTGVIERFGRFVLGTTGWRAEWVIIRALLAQTTEVGLELEQKYNVPVYYRQEGAKPWT